jgi:hypothetical protein
MKVYNQDSNQLSNTVDNADMSAAVIAQLWMLNLQKTGKYSGRRGKGLETTTLWFVYFWSLALPTYPASRDTTRP